jgi:hypothetical protein
MMAFAEFLKRLLEEGSVVMHARPEIRPADQKAAGELLAAAFADERLEVAGPLLTYDAKVAIAAAECVWFACWFLLHHGEPAGDLEKLLTLLPPRNPAQHLSADLTLRYLPQVHRRARSLAADDVLTGLLTTLLRQWPLSGVLSDVEEAPLTPPEFDGHHGLLMLYAERYAAHPKPAWTPEGPGLAYIELVTGREQPKE